MATTGQDGGGTVYIRPVVSADGVAAGVADIKREFASIPGAADQAAKATNKSLANLGAGGGKGLDEVAAATQRAVKQIERLNLELESGGRNTAAYIAGRAKLAGADVNALAPLIAQNEKLRAATALTNAEFTKAGKVFDQFGMTAKQTTAALRQVPAQFTDIVVSLQGGQAPLTVLLQQGGQLKDVFGGVGNAARALGGYVVGLVNPFTLAAAAVGGVAAAYYAGSQEADAFRKALVFSGNQVGLTTGGLADMAKNMGAVSGTTGAAASALATFAASGAVGAAGIQKATEAAIALEKYGGQAVAETVKQFKSLGDDPLKASIRLNDAVNFLTTSLYEQIKALEEQGRTVEAAALAQDAFSKASLSSAGEIQDNLGYIERGWLGVKSAILEAVDAAKGIGRPETIGAQITAKQALITNYQKNGYDTTKEQAELEALNRIALREQDIATSKAQQKLETENLVAANKILDSFASKQVKMEKEILASRTALVRAGIDNKIVEETIGKIREKYKEKAAPKETITDAQRSLASYLSDVQKRIDKEEELTEVQKAQNLLASLGTLGQIAQVRELVLGRAALVDTQVEEGKAAKESAKALEEKSKALNKWYDLRVKDSTDLDSQISKRQKEVAAIGQTAEAVAALTAAKYDEAAANQEAYAAALQNASAYAGEFKDAYLQAAQDAKDQAAKLRELSRLETVGGAKEAAKKASKEAKKAAEDAAKEWQKTADKINDGITDALMRGFESGKGFAENLRDTIENIFKTMVLRPVVQATVNTGLGALGIPGVGGSSGGAGGLLNAASNLNTLYGTASQALFGASVGASTASLVGANAVGAVGGDALGALIAGNGGWAGVSVAAEAGAAAGAASGAAAASTAAGTAAAGTGAAGALAAIPGWGWALGGALLLAGMMGGDNGPKLASTGDAIRRYDKGGALTENGNNDAWFFTNTADANKLLDGLESRYQKAAKALGIGTVATQFDYGSNNRGNFALAGAAGNSRANTGEIAYSAEAMQVAASRAVFAALQGSELPKYLSGLLDSVGDINALSQAQIDDVLNTAQAFKGLHDVMVQMPFEALHDLSYNAAKGLVEFSGGLDKLTQNLGTYYDNFYSAEEKKAQTLANITRTLTDAGALTRTTRTAIAGEFDVRVGAQGDTSLEQRYATSIENLDMPKTREEFRALAESLQDLGGEAAQKAYAALMSVSGAFASITPAAQDAKAALEKAAADAAAALEKDLAARASWQQKLDLLTGKTTERALSLQSDLAGTTDAATQALIRQVYAQEDLAAATQSAIEAGNAARAALLGSATTAAQDAFGTLSRSVAAQKAQDAAAFEAQKAIATAAYTSQAQIYQDQIDATRQSLDSVGNSVGKLQSLSGSLKSTLDGMRIAGSDGAYRADAQAQISAAVARARSGGGLPLDGQLASALATVSKPSEQLFGTFQDYARDFYKTANDIAALSSLTDAQLTADQVTQDILADQIKVLDDQKRTLKDGFAEQVSALDDILTNAQLQLDAANGLNVSVLSVADALNGFASAVSALETTRAGQGLATTVNAATTAVSGQRQTDILSYLQGVNSNTQLSDFEKAQTVYTRAQIEGVTEAEIARAWGASAEETRRWFGNAGVPQFAVGTNYVPRDMLAQIHEGEAIVPKAYNPAAGGQGGSNAELVAELRQLRAAYERQQAALDKIEKSTRSTDTTLRNVTPNGDSLQTVAA